MNKPPKTDDEIIKEHHLSVRHRAKVELAIVHALIEALRKSGYEVRVDDGDDNATLGSEQELVEKIFGVDESNIVTRKTGCKRSFVFLVRGNEGHDIICDYGVSLETVMDPLQNWIESQVENGTF